MIVVADAKNTIENMFLERKFNSNNLNPIIVWESVKEFATIEVDCEDDSFLFQCGTFDFTGEEMFYWDIVRQFSVMEDGEYDHMEQLHIAVLYKPNDKLNSLSTEQWSYDFDSKEDFFKEVESLDEFQIPVKEHIPVGFELYQEEV